MTTAWEQIQAALRKMKAAQAAANQEATTGIMVAESTQENPPIFGEEPSESGEILWKRYFETNGFPRTIIPNMDTVGNYATFGPLGSLGKYSKYGTLVMLLMLKKIGDGPDGKELLARMVIKYLDSMAKVISSMQTSSAGNWLTALMNQRTMINMLARVGFISPYDQFSESVWLDHIFAEMEKLNLLENTIGSLTTLVTGSTYEHGGESGAGLGAVAKMLAGT